MPADDPNASSNHDPQPAVSAPPEAPLGGGIPPATEPQGAMTQGIPPAPPPGIVVEDNISQPPPLSAGSVDPAQTNASFENTQPLTAPNPKVSDAASEVPPPPPPTLPPAGVLNAQPNQPINPPPVPESQPGDSTVVPPAPKRNFTTLIIIFVILVVLGLGGFAVYKFLLPLLSGTVTGETTLTWWGLWEDEAVVGPLISEYEQTHPGIKINYQRQLSTDYRERLTNELAKGQGPDIFRFHNSWVPMFRSELDTVPATVMNAADFSQNYYPVALSDLSSGTGFVGIPLEYDALMLYVNEDLFAASGRTVPETWDDLRKTALELTVVDEQGNIVQSGAALGRTENVDHWQEILALLMIQNGVNLTKPTGPLAEDALSYFTLFSTVDGVWDETLPPSTAAFAAGKVAMYIGPSWRYFDIKEANPSLNFKTYKVPQLPKDNPNDPDITYASYWVEGVWARSPHKSEAWDFIKFISSKESLEKLYANASKVRAFGEPYPRVDMQQTLLTSPELGPVMAQAGGARSWYLASRTFDGPTGINAQMSKYFEDAVNAANEGRDSEDLMDTVASGVAQVLAQYSAK